MAKKVKPTPKTEEGTLSTTVDLTLRTVQLEEELWRSLAVADLKCTVAAKEKKIQEKELALLKVDVTDKERAVSQVASELVTLLKKKNTLIEKIVQKYSIDPKAGFELDYDNGTIQINSHAETAH